jgi:hypothetical protein
MKTNNKNQKSSELKSRPEQLSTGETEDQGQGIRKGKPFVNFKEREANRQMPTDRVLAALRRWMPRQYELAQVVGEWVWIQFSEIPVEQVRRELSQLGFHWNRRRQTWQHPCGKMSAGSNGDPREKYTNHFAAKAA